MLLESAKVGSFLALFDRLCYNGSITKGIVMEHTRWTEEHRNQCDDCRQLYEEQLNDLEYEEEEC